MNSWSHSIKPSFENISLKNYIKYEARKIICGQRDNSIKVRDMVTGVCYKTLVGHSSEITCLKLLKTGQLASGSQDRTIKIWNLVQERCIFTLTGHTNAIICLEPLTNTILISSALDNYILVWDLVIRQSVKIIQDESICLKALSDKMFASGSSDIIKIYDSSTGECLKTITDNLKYVPRLELTSNNKLVSCMEDKTLHVTSLNDGIGIKFLDGHTDFISCLRLNNKGENITGTREKCIKVWDMSSHDCLTISADCSIFSLKLGNF